MSWEYGWNAQSALLPEKIVEIKVGNKGLQKLKAAMKMSKQKNEGQSQKILNCQIGQNKEIKRNKGVEERNNRDMKQKSLQSQDNLNTYAIVQQQLEKKQKIYSQNQKKSRNHSQFLVDFVQKQLSKEDEELESLKKDFYAGKLAQIIQHQQQIHQGQQVGGQDQIRQNLAWQREVLEQLKGEVEVDRVKVAQSFDRKLTSEEKVALQQIVNQRLKQKQRLEDITNKRQSQQLQKLRKLRKLDILSQDEDD